jgi:hypothetical protein
MRAIPIYEEITQVDTIVSPDAMAHKNNLPYCTAGA